MATGLFGFGCRIYQGLFGPANPAPAARRTVRTGEPSYLLSLRPRNLLKQPRRLPNTPTKSHQPGEPLAGTYITEECPHCHVNVKVNVKFGRIAKPSVRATRPRRKRPMRRYVAVQTRNRYGDEYLLEDRSPVPIPRDRS